MAKVKTGPKTKRRGGGIPAKAKAVEALQADIERAGAIIVTDYRGLRVQELQDLRRKLRPRGIEYHVVKNSLFSRAAEHSQRGAIASLLTGPTAVALGGGDEAEFAKGVMDETRPYRAMKIVGAFIGGRALGADDVQSLARLPGRPQLQATLVGILQAPLTNVVATLEAPLGNLIRVLMARAEQTA